MDFYSFNEALSDQIEQCNNIISEISTAKPVYETPDYSKILESYLNWSDDTSALSDVLEEQNKPIINALLDNNKQLKETLELQREDLIESKRSNELLKTELEESRQSEKNAKKETIKAKIISYISLGIAIVSIISDIVIAILK